VEQNSLRREYAIVMRGNAVRARKSFTKRIEAWRSKTTITTSTPDVSRIPGANLHRASQGLPPLANGLVGEGLNEQPNSQSCKQCGIIIYTQGGEAVLMLNEIHSNENMPLLLGGIK